MPLLIVEGARKSGKTYLISKQDKLPVFKFDFNENFIQWDLGKQSTDAHWMGLGKEIMLHELNKKGFLPKTVVDRGILTNSVWGVFQNRITKSQAEKDLINFYKRGLFKGVKILLIEGDLETKRKKDIWDEDDARREEEKAIFSSFSLLLRDLGIDIDVFHNKFDIDSLIRFKIEINKF